MNIAVSTASIDASITDAAKKPPAKKASTKIAAVPADETTTTIHIPLDLLDTFPNNPRRQADPAAITDLSYSLVEKGQIQNLTVRTKPDGRYEVYVGFRRYSGFMEAAARGDLPANHLVRCELRDCDDNEAYLIALAENIQRENMSPLDECFGIHKAITDGASPKELSRAIGLTPRDIEARAAVATMPAFVHELVSSDKRPLAWATRLVRLSPAQITTVSDAIANNESAYASIGQIEALAKSGKISVATAIFDVPASKLEIDEDLFGGSAIFVDTDAFWLHQNAAVDAKVSELEALGHDKVTVLHTTFQDWKYQQVDSPIDAEAIICISNDGFVEIHERMLPISKANVLEENADADMAFFGAPAPQSQPIENNNENAEIQAPEANISITPPGGKAGAAMARWRRDAVALAMIVDPKLARRVELAAAFGDTRLPQATPPAKIDLPAGCPQSIEFDAYVADFDHAAERAKSASSPFAFVLTLEDDEVDKLLAIATAIRLPNQKGRHIVFTSDSVASEIAKSINLDYRAGFTPNETFFEPYGLQDLRSLATTLLEGQDALQARNASRTDVISLLCQSFDDAANNRNLNPAQGQRLNTWVPEYF